MISLQSRKGNRSQNKPKKRFTVSKRYMGSPQPPQFNAAPTFRHRFRYMSSAALVNVNVTSALLMPRIVMALTATTTVGLFNAFRIRSVEMWGPPAATLAPVTVSVEFETPSANAGFGTKRRLESDTSVGATRVAHVFSRPLPDTPAAAWQNSVAATTTTNGAGFILNGPTNTIVDVVLDLTLQNGDTPFTGPAGVAAVPGTLYYNDLDGSIAGLLAPVSGPPLV